MAYALVFTDCSIYFKGAHLQKSFVCICDILQCRYLLTASGFTHELRYTFSSKRMEFIMPVRLSQPFENRKIS